LNKSCKNAVKGEKMSQIIRLSRLHKALEPPVLRPQPQPKHYIWVDERSPWERLDDWSRPATGRTYRIGQKVRKPLFEPMDVFWGLLIAAFIICVWG